MNWTEFKRVVDEALASQNKTGDVSIAWIDVSYPESLQLTVHITQYDEMEVY